jgi:Predicted membrane protein (DUF2157)
VKLVERLVQWKDEGAITSEQYDALGVIVRTERFSVALELNALLYLGVVAVAGGVLWTVQTHVASIGDTAIVVSLTLIVAVCAWYCLSRARPYSPGEVESPTALFDYVLYFGCLMFATALAFIETRFSLLGRAWDAHVFVSAVLFFAAAYRFDNRFVLSLALSTLAAWFGITLAQFGFGSAGSLRLSALVYGALVAAMAAVLQRLAIKRHFVDTHVHVAATAAFVALTSGTFSGEADLLYLGGLLALAALSIAYGIRRRQFAFVAYGAVYPYVGLSLKLMHGMGPTAVMAYALLSGSAMVVLLVAIARRFGRDA